MDPPFQRGGRDEGGQRSHLTEVRHWYSGGSWVGGWVGGWVKAWVGGLG